LLSTKVKGRGLQAAEKRSTCAILSEAPYRTVLGYDKNDSFEEFFRSLFNPALPVVRLKRQSMLKNPA
jgi:hypothetical protein